MSLEPSYLVWILGQVYGIFLSPVRKYLKSPSFNCKTRVQKKKIILSIVTRDDLDNLNEITYFGSVELHQMGNAL